MYTFHNILEIMLTGQESKRDILYYDGVNPEVGKDSSTAVEKLKSIKKMFHGPSYYYNICIFI